MLSLLPLLCALPSTLALPLLAERIVPSLSCSPILPSYLASGNLFVRSSAVDGQLVPLGIDAGKNLTWSTTGKEAAGSVEGSFGFEVCNSTFMKTDPTPTTFYGHATFTPLSSNGSLPTKDEVDTLCLAADYAYEGSTPYLSPCSESDDSGQFLVWWSLEVIPSVNPALNGSTVLSFVGPSGTVSSYDGGLLGPSNYVPGGEGLKLTPENGTDVSFFTFDDTL